MRVCAHAACLEVENMQIRNPPLIHRKSGKKCRGSHGNPVFSVVLFAHQLLLSKRRSLCSGLHTTQTTRGSGNGARGGGRAVAVVTRQRRERSPGTARCLAGADRQRRRRRSQPVQKELLMAYASTQKEQEGETERRRDE